MWRKRRRVSEINFTWVKGKYNYMETRPKEHAYEIHVAWTGNKGQGTVSYKSYERAYEISAAGKPVIQGSSDPAFRGDDSRYNPEEMLTAALSACHMLSYLHRCAISAGVVVVTRYVDKAGGRMVETHDGGGRFTEVTLRPVVTITKDSDPVLAEKLHEQAHHLCFIANSVNFTVRTEPVIVFEEQTVDTNA